MKRFIIPIYLLLVIGLLVSACTPVETPSPTSMPTVSTPVVEPDIFLNIIWHQHQPFYAVDPNSGLVSAPWVRFHAAKDYVDMVTILEKYPNIHMTVNLTPSLLSQIDAFNAGQRDIVWDMTLIPAAQLTNEQKTYILQRFDLRGEGVWLGCELDEPFAGKAPDVLRAASDEGLLVLMAGPNVVRIAPSLLISLDEILEGLARLEKAHARALPA